MTQENLDKFKGYFEEILQGIATDARANGASKDGAIKFGEVLRAAKSFSPTFATETDYPYNSIPKTKKFEVIDKELTQALKDKKKVKTGEDALRAAGKDVLPDKELTKDTINKIQDSKLLHKLKTFSVAQLEKVEVAQLKLVATTKLNIKVQDLKDKKKKEIAQIVFEGLKNYDV